MKLADYVNLVFANFTRDPASTEYLRGYLSATINIRDQCIDDPSEAPIPEEIQQQIQ